MQSHIRASNFLKRIYMAGFLSHERLNWRGLQRCKMRPGKINRVQMSQGEFAMTIKTRIMVIVTVAFAAVLGLTACSHAGENTQKMDEIADHSPQLCEKVKPQYVDITGPEVTPAQIKTCEDANGVVIQHLFSSGKYYVCKQAYCDAGQSCSDSSECIGSCFVDTDAPEGETMGVCQASNLYPDCYTTFKNGKPGHMVCS